MGGWVGGWVGGCGQTRGPLEWGGWFLATVKSGILRQARCVVAEQHSGCSMRPVYAHTPAPACQSWAPRAALSTAHKPTGQPRPPATTQAVQQVPAALAGVAATHQAGRLTTKNPAVSTMVIITTDAMVCAVLGTMVTTPSSRPSDCGGQGRGEGQKGSGRKRVRQWGRCLPVWAAALRHSPRTRAHNTPSSSPARLSASPAYPAPPTQHHPPSTTQPPPTCATSMDSRATP